MLKQLYWNHGCGVFHDPAFDNRPVALVTGGWRGTNTEMLDLSIPDSSWISGPSCPRKRVDIVEAPLKDGLFLVRPWDVFKLKCVAFGDCVWEKLGNLPGPHRFAWTLMLIPDGLIPCGNSTQN